MNIVSAYVTGALVLIFVYLVVVNAQGANTILSGLSSFNTNAISALQGRGGGFATV